ncbi:MULTISPECIES: glycosyltransferase family 2 protein [Hyphobacterium]|uniref:Glycosyltransferase family 2 protein n=1 Tax=Hyphobacterium vulgare TaxID=1736751 RepID=A0ABV6ZVI4_9PROT
MYREYYVEFTNIVTSYYEEHSLIEFVSRLVDAMRATGRTFEVILINDGSTDQTFEVQKSLFERFPEVHKVIDIMRNSGQTAAMSCGISHARGENLIFIDSDLQLDPEEIPDLLEKFDAGADVVSGVRVKRKDHALRRLPSKVVNIVTRRIARHPVSDIGCTFKVYRGSLVYPFGFGPFKIWNTAFVLRLARDYVEVPITHHARRYGKSGWSIPKLIKFLFDQILGISSRPFLWFTVLSLALAIALALKFFASIFFGLDFVDEYTNGAIINVLLLGIILGIGAFSALGEFIFQIFIHVRQDPFYTERTVLCREHLLSPSRSNEGVVTRLDTNSPARP